MTKRTSNTHKWVKKNLESNILFVIVQPFSSMSVQGYDTMDMLLSLGIERSRGTAEYLWGKTLLEVTDAPTQVSDIFYLTVRSIHQF